MKTNLTFFDALFVSLFVMLGTSNDMFMTDMRWAHIPWYLRYAFGLLHWAVVMGIAAGLWRLVMGKGRWS